MYVTVLKSINRIKLGKSPKNVYLLHMCLVQNNSIGLGKTKLETAWKMSTKNIVNPLKGLIHSLVL